MTDLDSKYQRKFENRLKEFSGSYMNNTKWIKLFDALSNENQIIKKCYVKDIWDDVLREIEIPSRDLFDEAFSRTGINDVFSGGPYEFTEIEKLIFPKNWSIQRKMRDENLNPFEYAQDIDKIKTLITSVGLFEIEHEPESLVIYGYK